MKVLDSSAIMAFLLGQEGSDVVEEALREGACCSAASWSEVAQRIRAHGRDWPLARALLQLHELRVEPVTEEDAELAARIWRHGSGLGLADRCSLALAHRLGAPVLTADPRWGSVPPAVHIR